MSEEEKETEWNEVGAELKIGRTIYFMDASEQRVRELNRYDVLCLRPYLLLLKEKELGFLHCEGCGVTEARFEFHHKQYGLYVTTKDLMLLCDECHQDITPTMA